MSNRKEFNCTANCNQHPKHASRMYNGNYKSNVDYTADQIYRLTNRGYCQAGDTNVCDRAKQHDINSVKPFGSTPNATFTNTHHQRHRYMETFPSKRYRKYNNTLVYTQLSG